MKFNDLKRTTKWVDVKTHFYKTQPNKEEFNSSHAEHIASHFENSREWSPLRNFFFERMCAAEFHWFFIQGVDALMYGLYVPAVSSLLNGLEASLRLTLHQINNPGQPLAEVSSYRVLSNKLIKDCSIAGMPVEWLAFPNEIDFGEKLDSEKPNKIDVEVVLQRNNICHGNITAYIDETLGKENSFFTPVSVRKLAFDLLEISGNWAENLGEFRKNSGLLHYDSE